MSHRHILPSGLCGGLGETRRPRRSHSAEQQILRWSGGSLGALRQLKVHLRVWERLCKADDMRPPLRDGWGFPSRTLEVGEGQEVWVRGGHESMGISGHRAGQVQWGWSRKVCALSQDTHTFSSIFIRFFIRYFQRPLPVLPAFLYLVLANGIPYQEDSVAR